MPSEMKRLRQLEDENIKLKRIVADLSLDRAMLQMFCQKSSEACSQTGPCRQAARRVEGIDQACLLDPPHRPRTLRLQVEARRSGRT